MGRRETGCTREHSRTLVHTPSTANLCTTGLRTCQACSGWLVAPEGSSNAHAENKELPLVGLELLRQSSVQRAPRQNEDASRGDSMCAEATPGSVAARRHSHPVQAGK